MSLTEDLRKRNSFMNTTEVIALIGVRRNTLCSWIGAGRFPAIRTPSGYRFDPHDVACWMEQRTIGTCGCRDK